MIERNVGSAALIGGKARIGGNAFGGKRESGTIIYDGMVTLDGGEGDFSPAGELVVGCSIAVTFGDLTAHGVVGTSGGSIYADAHWDDHPTDYIEIDATGIFECTGQGGFTPEDGEYHMTVIQTGSGSSPEK